MNDSGAALPWHVIRREQNGNRYRVGQYATRAEAQKLADSLDGKGGQDPLYLVEHVEHVEGGERAERGERAAERKA
ncbi:SPOR domain-containing protein [Streptomyces tsukubensis]|nr:SPOR domain-containing protein [Streptomyces tsukubensis]QFR95537.1 hypothetical protein GBW32_24070 [Streptomyces tsukubensis]